MSCKIINSDEMAPESEKMLENGQLPEAECMLENGQLPEAECTQDRKRRLTEFYASLPLTDETTCGIGCCRGSLLQRFANKKAFVILYGITGCIFSACFAYFNGTITTIEKRFRITSKTSGIITVGNDISQLFITILLSYYAGRGHRPRWVALGLYTVVIFCLMNALPHFIYGPGWDSLILTKEYGGMVDKQYSTSLLERETNLTLCQKDANPQNCNREDGSLAPAVILFVAQLISGFGGSLYFTLGVSYMDDNIKKSKTPALIIAGIGFLYIGFSYFLRMLGPALGYSLASLCLKMYISPTLTPTITTSDPRWLGAWWLGWIILGTFLATAASLLALFPKSLPRAAARRQLALIRAKEGDEDGLTETELPASLSDLLTTFKRLIMNPTLTCNNMASVFYFIGYLPFYIFLPKYIETMYKQSASFASLITGTVGLVFSAIGILVSGLFITKYKPRARSLAMWNVLVGMVTTLGVISYIFLGCSASINHIDLASNGQLETKMPCNTDCHCDYVKYSPVCSSDKRTYISACHAGCQGYKKVNNTKIFTDCNCVKKPDTSTFSSNIFTSLNETETDSSTIFGGSVTAGSCNIDCTTKFYMFLAVCCIIKFTGATGRTSNFLVSVRCVEEKDKPVAIALGMTIVSLLAFIPSPILFGYIIDQTCIVWGKTCRGTGNCWLYNGESLRYILNITSACFIFIGTLCDAGVWFYVKNLTIFDDEDEKQSNGKKPSKG